MFDGIPLIYVFIEPDSGGQAVMKWLARSRIRERVKIVRLSGAKDVSELHLKSPEGFGEAFDNARKNAVPCATEAKEQGDHTRAEAW